MSRKPVVQKIEDARQSILYGDRSGSFEFFSKVELCEYIGMDYKSIQRNKEDLINAGFVFPEQQIYYIEEKILDAAKRIEDGDRNGSFEFSTLEDLYKYIDMSKRGFYHNKEVIENAGFVFPKKLSIEERIEDAVKRIEYGDRDGSFVFKTQKILCEYIKISEKSFRKNKEKLINSGFIFPEQMCAKEKILDAAKRIGDGDRDGSFEFSTLKDLYKYIDISQSAYWVNREQVKDLGFVLPLSVQERVTDAVKRIEDGDRNGSFEFDALKELSEYIDVSYSVFFHNKNRIKSAGFVFPERTATEEKISDAVKRIEEGGRDGSFEFATSKDLSLYTSICKQSLRENNDKIENAGFVLPEKEISKNIQQVIKSCKIQGVKLERGELLPDMSKEFFSKHIRPFENIDDYKAVTIDIVQDYSQEEKINFVKESVLKLLSEDRSDYSLLELKLELFTSGVYFGDSSIAKALIELGENVDREDSMQKRLRLCTAFVNHGLVEIEYMGALPILNNSLDGNVMLNQRINNKKTLMELWREYTLYSIKNEITGHVSKTRIPYDWDGKLDSLFSIIPSYEKAYLLDKGSIWFLEKVGYEGILAMCQFGSKQSKSSLTQMHRSIHARCIGFFMYLNRKKYALLQPKYIIFTGANSVSDTVRTIMKNHSAMSSFSRLLEMDVLSQSEHKKMSQKNVELQALKFAGSVLDGCDLSAVPSKDFYGYLEHNSHEGVSGTIIHETFVLTLLRGLGNHSAIEKKKVFNFDNEVLRLRHLAKLNEKTLSSYKKLLSELIDVVHKLHKDGMSNGYIKQYLNIVYVFMRFLDTFPKKLNRKEMTAVLNTVICSDVDNSFTVWGKENLSDTQYADFTTKMFILFDNITINEYRGLYSRSWKVVKKPKTRTLIREGMNAEAYSILQNVAIYDPPHADEYPFAKTTPQGKQLDLGWWPHDFSPIPAFCNWLIVKTTRRKVNVRHLDVNSFLRFDEEGNLTHMHFNTDKNRSSKESDIAIALLRYIFTPEELNFLKKYVDYIKNAYSNMAPVPYQSSSEHFGKIMPLFPHHSLNAVIAENWVDGYHVKTMLKTEMILKTEVKKGAFDHFIEEQDRERRKDDLAKIKLVSRKPAGTKELPSNMRELDNISIPSYASNFTVMGGIHNMRHAGVSALGAQLPLVYVRIIAGHTDINTTFRVYFHANDKIIGYEIEASLNEPVGVGSKFIHVNIMPFIESENPEEIEKILLDNHFMTASREIQLSSEREMIEDGLSRGATLHPSLWVPQKYGICVNNQQCPLGTNGCCALCPFNMFSPMHIKGVIYELNTCLEDIALISQKIALDARDGVNVSREEMKDAHQQKIKEMAAWFGVLDMINDKMKVLGYSTTKNLPVSLIEESNRDLYSMSASTIEESMVELLVDAKTLQINDLETDNRISKISHKLMQAAIHRKDYKALDRMANEGIQYIVDEYGKKAMSEKKEYLLQHLGSDRLADNAVSLVSGSKTTELPSAI